MILTRYQDWASRLVAYIDDQEGLPFAWGEVDCATFATGAVDAMCGSELRKRFTAAYDDADSALAFCDGSVVNFVDQIAAECGANRVAVPYTQRGDVVACEPFAFADTTRPFDALLGVCLGTVGAFRGKSGAVHIPIAKCCAAWGFGRD